MPRRDDYPDPPRMEVKKILKGATAFCDALAGRVRPGRPVAVEALKLASAAAALLRMPDNRTGSLAREYALFIGDRRIDARLVFRLGIFTLANSGGILSGRDLESERRERSKRGNWEAVQVTDVMSGGFTKRGTHLWNASGVYLWGPLAGRDLFLPGSDGYFCGIVREISGARYSKNVAPVDLACMRFRAFMEDGGIRMIDGAWPSAREINSKVRRTREGCPKGPCETCTETRERCPCSPRPMKEKESEDESK